MKMQQIAIGKIKANPRNARTHSAKQVRQIADSIVAFGFTNPLLLDEDCELIAGHGRYEAAKLLGLAEVPIIVVCGLSEAKRRALAIADNRIAEGAAWDRDRLAIEIPELTGLLGAERLDISILGFEAIEIEQIQTDLKEQKADPRDRIEPKWCEAMAVSKPGDLWLLGKHKLLCGNGCSADVARLMTDRRADLVFIDLPNITESSSPVVMPMLSAAFNAATTVSRDGAIHFVGMDWRHTTDCMAAATPIYGEPLNLIVWVKSAASQGAFYGNQHEFICMFRVGGPRHPDLDLSRHGRRRSNVWRYRGTNPFGSSSMDALRSPPNRSHSSPTPSGTARSRVMSSSTCFPAGAAQSWLRNA
jgi:ParB-like nuclease domain